MLKESSTSLVKCEDKNEAEKPLKLTKFTRKIKELSKKECNKFIYIQEVAAQMEALYDPEALQKSIAQIGTKLYVEKYSAKSGDELCNLAKTKKEMDNVCEQEFLYILYLSVQKENIEAICFLSRLFSKFGKRNTAAFWLVEAAKKGDIESQKIVKEEIKKIASVFNALGGMILPDDYCYGAILGYSMAQFNVGKMYLLGRVDGKPNIPLAKKWLEKAASQDCSESRIFWGRLLQDGYDGIPQDIEQAKKFLEKPKESSNAGLVTEFETILNTPGIKIFSNTEKAKELQEKQKKLDEEIARKEAQNLAQKEALLKVRQKEEARKIELEAIDQKYKQEEIEANSILSFQVLNKFLKNIKEKNADLRAMAEQRINWKKAIIDSIEANVNKLKDIAKKGQNFHLQQDLENLNKLNALLELTTYGKPPVLLV